MFSTLFYIGYIPAILCTIQLSACQFLKESSKAVLSVFILQRLLSPSLSVCFPFHFSWFWQKMPFLYNVCIPSPIGFYHQVRHLPFDASFHCEIFFAAHTWIQSMCAILSLADTRIRIKIFLLIRGISISKKIGNIIFSFVQLLIVFNDYFVDTVLLGSVDVFFSIVCLPLFVVNDSHNISHFTTAF